MRRADNFRYRRASLFAPSHDYRRASFLQFLRLNRIPRDRQRRYFHQRIRRRQNVHFAHIRNFHVAQWSPAQSLVNRLADAVSMNVHVNPAALPLHYRETAEIFHLPFKLRHVRAGTLQPQPHAVRSYNIVARVGHIFMNTQPQRQTHRRRNKIPVKPFETALQKTNHDTGTGIFLPSFSNNLLAGRNRLRQNFSDRHTAAHRTICALRNRLRHDDKRIFRFVRYGALSVQNPVLKRLAKF